MIEIDNSQAKSWKIQGPLVLTQLSVQLDLFKIQGPKTGSWVIDLSGIEQLDCAGVGFLLHWVRWAKTHKIKLKLQALNVKFHPLIQVYGVFDLLSPYFDKVD